MTNKIYQAKNQIRIVTATSLFDGHDVAINIMRKMMQTASAEVIHLGHNRSVQEIVTCAIQEDVQAIAVSSYQGGHLEYYKYMVDLLKEYNAHIKIFGGGGGVILPHEIKELHDYGLARIYSPDDARKLGLQGMINDLLQKSDFPTSQDINVDLDDLTPKNIKTIASLITVVENGSTSVRACHGMPLLKEIKRTAASKNTPIIGITGTGGSGKSTLIDELLHRLLIDFQNKSFALISVDPTKRKTGGALLGDRIRMNAINSHRVYMRSMATRESGLTLPKSIQDVIDILKASSFDMIFLESSGIGQSDTEIVDHCDLSMYVMTPEYGAATQLEKIDMLDFADLVVLNKFDKRGAQDALHNIKKQYQRNHQLWDTDIEKMPVYGTIASQFNDPGVHKLHDAFIQKVNEKYGLSLKHTFHNSITYNKIDIILPNRINYLAEISETIKNYNNDLEEQSQIANQLFALNETIKLVKKSDHSKDKNIINKLLNTLTKLELKLHPANKKIIENWDNQVQSYKNDDFKYIVRNQEINVKTFTESLSKLKIPKISLPKYQSWGDILKWSLKENVPGSFPYAAGVFPFKRENEEPTRMFAGEGSPERTNRRFHYLSKGITTNRLSTAFDSVTLYGEDPNIQPDIYGKIGNAGVSIACLDDMKKLYSGFDLCDPLTSVSMTINGPAAVLVAYFMNIAIDQQCEKYIRENGLERGVRDKITSIFNEKALPIPEYVGGLPETNNGLGLMLLGVTGDQVLPKEIYDVIKAETLSKVRGTVQADILKEDQAQNTCIFSIDFALKLMGDVQEFFIQNNVQNFYSVSVSGYHIAEAGANPITQLAFTLANGFTYVEYYLSRGFDINDFAPNLSFFFSSGMDPEYSVIGRVARIIWAKVMKLKYKADSRSQKLKYHIQTSGRSLHAQEVGFNDIRTTLQALYAIYDNCNSLHTNAFDEAVTTPTEDSVRRALAIQMIINHELGQSNNQNPLQGSFYIEELTDLVEEAILSEFNRLTERGGVLGAMETMYQRSKIQSESHHYEKLKESGEIPIMGVNTFLSSVDSLTMIPNEVIRSTEEEKNGQINMLNDFHKRNQEKSNQLLNDLKQTVIRNENLFDSIMEASKYCSLGQITNTLYKVGGKYRRNM